MKTVIGVVAGALCGAAITYGYLKANPPGAEKLAEVEKQLADTQFDLAASKKAETRLREQTTELKQSEARANAELADAIAAAAPAGADRAEDERKSEGGFNNFAEVMEGFGKAQADHAFTTLVKRLGLEGEDLEAFTAVFEAMRSKRQGAYAKILTGGATLEEMAMIEGYTPTVDEWVAQNGDAATRAEYDAYKAEQEVSRIERKANEELTWLSSIASLTSEQKDAAYDVFADHWTREKPEQILEIGNLDEFREVYKTSVDSRMAALDDVLDESQIGVYQQQTEIMAKMAEGFLSGAFENE